MLLASNARAQLAPPLPVPQLPPLPQGARAVQDPAQRLLQQQRDQQRNDELQQAPAQISVPEGAVPNLPAGADVESLPDVAPMFRIDHIEFTGDSPVSRRALDEVAQPFIGRMLGRNRINLLLRRLTEAFIAHGYITTRAYLGQQNLASGTLTINVVAGRIAAFTLNGQPLRPRSTQPGRVPPVGGGFLSDDGTAWAFGASQGDALRLPDLEQGVDQINRLRRNQAQIQIVPGEAPGDSIVAITNHFGGPFYVDAGLDNYGSSSTGTLRYRASLEADNAIGFQESLGLSYVGSENSNALVFSAAVPFGYQTLSYTTALSEYQQAIGDTALLDGRTFSQTLGWNDVLTRSASGRTSLDATLTKLRTERSVNGIELSPQDLTVARIGVNGLYRFSAHGDPAAATWDLGISQGLPWLSASHDGPDIDNSDAHSQFTMGDATLTLQATVGQLGALSFAYRGRLRAQYSPVALFGNEQIFLGGMDSVRGFTEGGIAGDSGFYLRNETVWQNAPACFDTHLEPYAFLDGGKSHLVAQGGWPTLMGAGVGVRAARRFGNHTMTGEVLVGRALLQPASMGEKATVVLATINWSE
ncbi:ShlB/FhaC/HecB family hemolysin secretion/activation protein [Paraburkholderia guartelaensis]|uniref:ShlB/FhaC/HecB family hemolysin secretion/activation protein n=1 Tax=Paraburkholderia guartelaensis TaxID=2546446 RepID=A0A4R5L1G5_9BURK|nr:ShlB/FhaC/HecB family hemolysin secretion/activation protein [Paraburkholderia guartelaensis]TDG02337.1 ShlB/FhaC/HecB family hemolysin secretion/activation protein [Paraburkholderia guartelaensis]